MNFDELLVNLRKYTVGTVRKGINFFELIDPLVSDTQCHIHAVFLFDMLSMCCDGSSHLINAEKLRGFDVEKLGSEDKRLLAIACLLSSLKFSKKDEFGHMIYNFLVKALDDSIISGRRRQEKLITEAQGKFNLASTNFIKNFVDGKVKKILGECKAYLEYSGAKLKVLPCYPGMYAVICYMEEKKLPIIISLTRIKSEENTTLSMSSKDVFFYEFKEDEKAFRYKEQESLSKDEKERLTIAFFCFSLIGKRCPDQYKGCIDDGQLPSKKFLTEDCDIRNLLMMSAAGHTQLSEHAKLPPGTNKEEYAKNLYKESFDKSVQQKFSFESEFHQIAKNVLGAYTDHHKLAGEFGMSNAQYSEYKPNNSSDSIEVTRRKEDTLFAIDHVSLSNNLYEKSYIEGLNVGTELSQIEVIEFKKQSAVDEAVSKIQRMLTNLRI